MVAERSLTMCTRFFRLKWVKIAVVLLLSSISLLGIGLIPKGALSVPQKITNNGLYTKAFAFARNQDYFQAAIYLEAYRLNEPPMYINNINGHKFYVDTYLSSLYRRVNSELYLARQVRKQMEKCRAFPCSVLIPGSRGLESGSGNVGQLQPPPDVAVVCERKDYEGRCSFLNVGTYNSEDMGLPNDVISSVMVGSKVRLTLCLHGNLTGPCLSFTSNDSNLSNNPIDSRYNWDNNATSVKVTLR
jgi:hypothetical protein